MTTAAAAHRLPAAAQRPFAFAPQPHRPELHPPLFVALERFSPPDDLAGMRVMPRELPLLTGSIAERHAPVVTFPSFNCSSVTDESASTAVAGQLDADVFAVVVGLTGEGRPSQPWVSYGRALHWTSYVRPV